MTMASNSDFTETRWSSPSKMSREEPSKQALQALERAEDAALEFDEKFTARCNEREQTVPRFNGAEVEIGSRPLRNRGYYTEYELKSIVIMEMMEGDFADAENDPRTRLGKRCGDGHYAVKYIQEGLIGSDIGGNAAADAIFETKILMNLAPHPNICQIYGINGGGIDTFLESGKKRFFIITDRLSETLVDRLNLWREGKGYSDSKDTDDGTSRWMQRLEVALDIASALVYLHDRLLVYNVRPDKVGFDTRYGQVKLSNFSQVRQDGMDNHASSITKSDDIKTLAYTAPEVLCKAPATISSDVYGFGIMLWEILSLQRPFDGYDRSMHFEEVVQLNFRPALDLKWSKGIRDIVGNCWNPHRRPTIKATHESIEENLLFRDSEDELKQVFRTIKRNNSSAQNDSNSPSSPSKSPPKTKGSMSAPTRTSSKTKTPITPKTPKRSVSKQGFPGLPGSPAEQANGGWVAPKTPKTPKSGAPNRTDSSPRTPGSSAPNSTDKKSPKTPRSKALNRAVSSDGMPNIAEASGRQGRSLAKESEPSSRSRSLSISRQDDIHKEVPSLFAKLDSESMHENFGGDEDEVSLFSKLDAEFGHGSDSTAPTLNSSDNSAGPAGPEGKLYPPPTTPKQRSVVRKMSLSKISMIPSFGSLSQTTHGTFPKVTASPKSDSLSQTTHEVFSFGVFDDDPAKDGPKTNLQQSQPSQGAVMRSQSFLQQSRPTQPTAKRSGSFNNSLNFEKLFLAKDEVASLFDAKPAVEGQSSTTVGGVCSVADVSSGAGDSIAKWDVPSSKVSAEESTDKGASCNSREGRSASRDDEPSNKMKRSMSMGRRNSSRMNRSRSVGRRAASADEDEDSPSTKESPKSKQVSPSSNSRENRASSRDGDQDQASKMRRSRSVGRRMPVEDDDNSPSAGESTKSKQVSASYNSRESRASSRDGDQASTLKRSKSLGRRKPAGDEGKSPKSKQASLSSNSRESRHSSRDGDQASKMRRSRSVGRRMPADKEDSSHVVEVSNSKPRESRTASRGDDQSSKMRRSKSLGRRKHTDDEGSPPAKVTPTPKSRESRTSSRDDDQSSKMRRSKSLGRRKPSGDEGSPPAEAASRSRESRTSSRDDDQSSKMRRSKSTGRRMSSDDEGGAHNEAAPRSRESRTSSRDEDQSSKMRRSKSTGRRVFSDAEIDVPAGDESKPSESKPFRESRSSSLDDPSALTKRSKSTARSKSKGPSQRSKEELSEPKASSRGGKRTVIRMSSKELMEAGFDPANMPTGKSKGGRILVPGLDAKDMAGRVLERRKGKKKMKNESKEASMEEPAEEPSAASDFKPALPQAPELEA